MKQTRTWTEKVHKIQKRDRIKLLEYAGEILYPDKKRWITTSWATGGLELWYYSPNAPLSRECNDDLRFTWHWDKTAQIGKLRLWISHDD